MRRALPWLLFLLAAAAFVAALWRPDAVARRLGFGDMVSERRHAQWAARLHAHYRRLDANAPPGATLFFGASTVQGLAAARVAACAVNFGIGGETAAELAKRLPSYGSLKRAKAVVIGTGLNDVLRGQDRDIGLIYRRLLAAVPAEAPVILAGLQPLAPGSAAARDHAVAVTRANRAAAAACAARKNCTFVRLDGAVPTRAALWEPDGIHLGPAGYELWSRLLRDALARAGAAGEPCAG
jgi:lysophospholipase L1-like esterase